MSFSTSDVLDPDPEDFLQKKRIAVLATGRSTGSPQVSQVVCDYDPERTEKTVRFFRRLFGNF